MEKHNFNVENTLALMKNYNLTSDEIFIIKLILFAQEGDVEYLSQYCEIRHNLRELLESLQSKGMILKSYKIPEKGEKLVIEDIEFNKNFMKQYHRASFEMGSELFDAYPQSCIVNGSVYNLKRVSRKFDSLEDAFARYAKYIHNKPDLHQEVLDLIKWGIENQYNFTTLDSFIIDHGWLAIKAMKDGDAINVNTNAVTLI